MTDKQSKLVASGAIKLAVTKPARTVVVDETTLPGTATAFENDEAAKLFMIPLIEARLIAEDIRDEFPADLYGESIETLGEYESSVMALTEGTEGVWTGFSSADRSSIGGEFPTTDDEPWYGNGDPNVYRTVGTPDGTAVVGVEAPELGCEEEDDDEDSDD